MELNFINPELTIQNTDGGLWHVTVRHTYSDLERAEFTVLMPKSQKSLGQIQSDAIDQIQKHLTNMKVSTGIGPSIP